MAIATYLFFFVLYERISPRFAFTRSGFVEKEIEFGDLSEFIEDL